MWKSNGIWIQLKWECDHYIGWIMCKFIRFCCEIKTTNGGFNLRCLQSTHFNYGLEKFDCVLSGFKKRLPHDCCKLIEIMKCSSSLICFHWLMIYWLLLLMNSYHNIWIHLNIVWVFVFSQFTYDFRFLTIVKIFKTVLKQK